MQWNGGSLTTPDIWTTLWGDGIIIGSEKCDDGNVINDDGWSSTCIKETGFLCTRIGSSTPDICNEIWGDGKVIMKTDTNCDDGNNIDGDGWTHDCIVESGYVWSGGDKKTKDSWYTVWGDGILTSISEEWDDNNILDGDGCNSKWKVEQDCYWVLNSGLVPANKCTEYWGDSKNLGILQWDDGNLINGDGCDSQCNVEQGYLWSGGSKLK